MENLLTADSRPSTVDRQPSTVDRLSSMKWKMENGKWKVVVRRWRSFLFSFASLHGYYPSPRRGLPFCPFCSWVTFLLPESFGNLRSLGNNFQFSIFNFPFSIQSQTPPLLRSTPARRGRRAQFRPPLPTSPVVGEGDSEGDNFEF